MRINMLIYIYQSIFQLIESRLIVYFSLLLYSGF